MRVLVTGGGGFLGSNLARRLCERGDEVCIVGRREFPNLPEKIERIKADLCDPEAANLACEKRDVVFHTAAKAGIWGTKKEFYFSSFVF